MKPNFEKKNFLYISFSRQNRVKVFGRLFQIYATIKYRYGDTVTPPTK
jgi:hypothetical protein